MQLAEAVGRVFKLAEDDRSFVNREGEQLHVVGEGAVEPVGEIAAPAARTISARLAVAASETGIPASIMRTSIGRHERGVSAVQ